MTIRLKTLLKSLGISLGVGILSALFTMGSMKVYKTINQPALSPPSWLFPVVWTILFILMGISAYNVYESDSIYKDISLKVYGVQLVVNFLWSIIFFNGRLYLFSFIWLLLLWSLIIVMIFLFYKVKPIAGYLQIPYLIWVTFAAYLNFMIYILNR